ncbi:hypothetical protein AAC387_Pa02g2240 [Persea americana]
MENIKQKKVHTPVQEHPTINIHKDNDIHFSEPPSYDAIEQLKEVDRVVEEKEDEGAIDNVPLDTNSIGIKCPNAKLANPVNDADVSMY